MNSKLATAVCATLATATLAGCSGSGSSGGTSNTARASTPAPSSSSATSSSVPTTSAPTSAAPLSPFEHDPAVEAIRSWLTASAAAVNSGQYTSAAVRRFITPALAAQMKEITGSDVGLHYPGPVPFRPLGVQVSSSTQRVVRGCYVQSGFAENRKTGKPAAALKTFGADTVVVKRSGQWLVTAVDDPKGFSCKSVKVPMPR